MPVLTHPWPRAIVALTLFTGLVCGASGAELATAPAEYADVPRETRLDGVVEAVNKTTVSAQTQGQVAEILFDVDDYVAKGDVIVRLRDTEQQARLQQAEATLRGATARHDEAASEYRRTEEIFAKKLVSKSQMDKASAALKAAKADLDAATAGLAQAREQLEYTRVRAPYSGIVTERQVELGETAHPGTPLMSGLSLEKLRVNVNVPQSLIRAVREIGEARVLLPQAANGSLASSKLTIFPYAEADAGTFKVRVELDEGVQDLFPGMFVKVAFVTGHSQRLLIPREAVVHRSELTGVYVVGADGRISLRQIRIGAPVGDKVTVLAGLEAGEKVALDPIQAGVALKQQATAHE